jgi:hypothetical protein
MPYKPKIELESRLEYLLPIVIWVAFAVLIAYWILREPTRSIANSSAFGCYISAQRPIILINEAGLQIINSDLPAVQFEIDWNDEGITIWPQNRLRLVDRAQDPFFEVTNTPGTAIRFIEIIDGRAYPDLDEAELDNFQLVIADDRVVAYSRTDMQLCSA